MSETDLDPADERLGQSVGLALIRHVDSQTAHQAPAATDVAAVRTGAQRRQTRRRVALVIGCIALSGVIGLAVLNRGSATDQQVVADQPAGPGPSVVERQDRATTEPLEQIAENLRSYGFADAATRVGELLATPEGRQAYQDYGVPLVGADLENFKEHLNLQQRVMPAIDYATSTPGFAASRINHAKGGEVEIYLKDPDGAIASAILDRVPAADQHRVSFHAAAYSASELQAIAAAVASSPTLPGVLGMDVDPVTATITLLATSEADRDRIARLLPELEARYHTKILVELGEGIRQG